MVLSKADFNQFMLYLSFGLPTLSCIDYELVISDYC